MNWLDAPPEDLLDRVLFAKEMTGESPAAASPDAREVVLAEIRSAQSEIRSLLDRGPDGRVLVHRAITFDAAHLAGLEPGHALGLCWAFERCGAHAYDGRRGRPSYLLSAWVEPDDVVGDHVLAMWSSGEGEARLDRRARIELVGIRDPAGIPVRTDLEGAEFGTGTALAPTLAPR